MPSATINYENNMVGWPPKTYLIQLETPMTRFDPETGDQTFYEWIALTCKESDPKEAYVFPSNENGEFVDPSMTPIRRREFGLPHAVLLNLGYTLTN